MRYSLYTQTGSLPDLLATSGDYLRIWQVSDNEARQECLLNNVSVGVLYSYTLTCMYLYVLLV